MRRIWIFIILFIFWNCNSKEEVIHPKGILISVIGDVSSGGRKLALGQEITDKDSIVVGNSSLCDVQLLESDSLVVIRVKANSRFQLSGKQLGSKKENKFFISLGNAIFNVSQVAGDDKIQTITPSITAGVRGTKYEVNVTPNGTTKIFVLEGKVDTKARIPDLDKFTRKEIKSSKVLKSLDGALEDKEIQVNSGESTEVSGDIVNKILKETGISDSLKKKKLEEIDQSVDLGNVEEKLSEMEDKELKFSTKQIDEQVRKEKLKEYDEIKPFEKDKINDKNVRGKLINARFKTIEDSWLQKFQQWLKGLKL